VVAPPVGADGDVAADQAEPADWYGRARYTLDFAPVADAAGYRVARAGTAALFALDAARHPPGQAPDYRALRNRDVMALAEQEELLSAFRQAHDGVLPAPPFHDVLDGRGLGRFVYRVRSVDAAGNASAWSAAFPVVEARDVTPPATPVVQSVTGAENAVVITIRAGTEPDLTGYRVWRADTPAELADVRVLPPLTDLPLTGPPRSDLLVSDTGTVTWTDGDLLGLTDWYYRIAAFDASGNVSAATPVLRARTRDLRLPEPPQWVRADREQRRGRAVVVLGWTAGEDGARCLLERRLVGDRSFTARTGWRSAQDGARSFRYVDPLGTDPRETGELTYRVRVRSATGNEQRYAFVPVIVPVSVTVTGPGEGP
jgi:hypothetical protein